MDFKDKVLTQKIIGYAFKIYSTLSKDFLKEKRFILNVIFKFIQSILKHPVRVLLGKSTTYYCPPNFAEEP